MVTFDTGGIATELTTCLSGRGYEVVATVSGSTDIVRVAQSFKPHLLLMSIGQDLDDKLGIIQQILSLRTTAIVIILKEWDAAAAKKALSAGVSGYLLRPFDPAHASATLETAWHHFQKLLDLQENLELRKLLEKAKGILMNEQFVSEEEAHQLILKMSQDKSIPLKDVCQSILQVKAVLGAEKPKK